MNFIDRLSNVYGTRVHASPELENCDLHPFEIRLITEGKVARLTDFAASSRLHTRDPRGDTPLHLAARMGNLAVCDLFIRSGADPCSMNYKRQTPADVAFAQGHRLAGQLLSSLVPASPATATVGEVEATAEFEPVVAEGEAEQDFHFNSAQEVESADNADELDDLLDFEAEVEPREFFGQDTRRGDAGTFVALVNSLPMTSNREDEDWDLDLSRAPIAGEGIGSSNPPAADTGAEHDFLKARNRGRKSVKRAVVQTGTWVSIDQDICVTWAEEILAKGWCSFDDVERLVVHCQTDGDLEDLQINIQRNLEAADIDLMTAYDVERQDTLSEISSDELAEAVVAALSRRTPLPGTRRFIMDKSVELKLLEAMVRAKQELHLAFLASEAAVKTILEVVEKIYCGSRDPRSFSMRTIIPLNQNHEDTSEVMAAAHALRTWFANGRALDGRQRREALAALEALDLSLAFQKELTSLIRKKESDSGEADKLDGILSAYEAEKERMIIEHLPYARRFAARNTYGNEDPEDVFQVAFLGLQQSARRFNPDRGVRFVVYCTFWMHQTISRWRADEGVFVRVPVYRQEDLAKIDAAVERREIRGDIAISDYALAAELEWTTEKVNQFRKIPRKAEYPSSLVEWDALMPEIEQPNAFEQAETERIVAKILGELPKREADVIRMRFGIGCETEMTLEQISHLYGLTRQRISQIEVKAFRRLHHPERQRRLKDLLGM